MRMTLDVQFNRGVDVDTDYIVPGGFCMTMGEKNVEFDFEHFDSFYINEDHSSLQFCMKDVDKDTFPGVSDVTADDLKNISDIKECFVYVGEEGETDLAVTEIKAIVFEVDGVEPIPVSQNVLDKYNRTLKEQYQGGNNQ